MTVNIRSRTEEFSAGDVGYVPQSYGHYIENTGESDLEVLQVWDNGVFEEISLANWMANQTPELLATNFGVPASTFDAFSDNPSQMPEKWRYPEAVRWPSHWANFACF